MLNIFWIYVIFSQLGNFTPGKICMNSEDFHEIISVFQLILVFRLPLGGLY